MKALFQIECTSAVCLRACAGVPDTSGSLDVSWCNIVQEAQTVPGAMDVEEHVMTEQEAEEFVICVSLRKSTRALQQIHGECTY